MSELIPIREAARRLGVSDTAVHKAIKTGRVTIAGKNPNNQRPLLSWPECKNDWEANSNPVYRTHVGGTGVSKQRQAYAGTEKPVDGIKSMHQEKLPPTTDGEDLGDMGDKASLAEARRQREVYQAKLAKLEYEQKSGKLVDADEVEARWAKMITAAKTRILGIPAACKSRASDLPLPLVAIIDSVCRESLENLANSVAD